MTKVWIVVRTKPSLAIVGAFGSKAKADACVEGCPVKCIVEEWNVA